MEVPSRSDWKKDDKGNNYFIYYHKKKAPIIDEEMKNPICNYGYRNAVQYPNWQKKFDRKYEIDLDNWRKESKKITEDYFFDDTSGVMINIGITPSTIHNLAEGNENPHYDGNDEGKWRDNKLLSNKDDSGRISPTNIQSGQTKIPGQKNVTYKWEKLKIKDDNTKEKDVNIVEDSESSDEEDANIQKDNIYPKKFMYEGKYAAQARKWAKEKAKIEEALKIEKELEALKIRNTARNKANNKFIKDNIKLSTGEWIKQGENWVKRSSVTNDEDENIQKEALDDAWPFADKEETTQQRILEQSFLPPDSLKHAPEGARIGLSTGVWIKQGEKWVKRSSDYDSKMKKQKMLIKMAKESKKAWDQMPKEGPDAANARKKAMQKYAIKQKKREKILQARNDARAEMEERLNERLRNLNIK